jgi:crotonobetainyl-CoA:carnitine CoA-transferase CaiB-like acyl-CoA transferase
MHPHAANFWMQGIRPGLSGNAHPSIAPYETFTVAGETLFLGVVNDGQFAKLCRVLELDSLAEDPRFKLPSDRVKHRSALHELLSKALARRWHRDLWRDLMVALGMEPEDGFFGVPFPVRLSRTPATQRLRPPGLTAPAIKA